MASLNRLVDLAHRRLAVVTGHDLTNPFIRDGITSYAGGNEYTTEFFQLNYIDDDTPLESGEVIRVQMPRSALITFGLPVNIERVDIPVKADLLLGEDGLARAIRFVR